MRVIPRKAALPFLLLALATLPVQAQVARVIETRGLSVVERPGEPPRILGAGETLERLDLVRTARDSHAIIEFVDQRRVTLRPNTVFRIDAYGGRAPESVALGLVRGGLRAESGRPDKGGRGLAEVQAGGTKIEARGGDFDVRLCEEDCAREQAARPAVLSSPDVIARVVEMKGAASAARPGGSARRLVSGASIHERESIVTGAGSYAVLVFRDGSRISLAENSQLAIPTFRFDERQRTGDAEIHHLAGGARVMTGAIGKQGPEHYRFISPLGMLRPHGTGWDSVAGAVGAAVDKGVDTVKQGGEALVNAVSDTAAEAARGALDRVTAPFLREMTKLVTELRANPPATEAEWNRVISQLTQYSSGLQGALADAVKLAGAAADLPAFKTTVGLALATEFETMAVMSLGRSGIGDESLPIWVQLQNLVAIARNDPYQRESLALVGLSDPELAQLRQPESRYTASATITTEVGQFLASQGSAAARDFFAEAQAAAGVLQEQARQAAEAAKLAAEQAAKLAAEEAARKAEEMKRQIAARLTEGKSQLEQAGGTVIDAAKQAGTAAARGVQDVASEAAQRALETATTPILREMTRLMSILRNNPPAAAAEWNQLVSQMRQLSGQLQGALTTAVNAAGAAADSPAFKSIVGLALAAEFDALASLAQTPAYADATLSAWLGLREMVAAARQNPYESESLALVGLSDADLERVYNNRYSAGYIINTEVGSYVASQGNAAARDFFAAARAAADAAKQANEVAVETILESKNQVVEAVIRMMENQTRVVQAMTRDGTGSNDQGTGNNSGSGTAADASSTILVWDGAVEVVGRNARTIVRTGQVLNGAGAGAAPRDVGSAPRPDLVKVDSGLFGGSGGLDPGLYVWARDGSIFLVSEGRTVEVPAGSAAVVTGNTVTVLETVPSFLRFDQTPVAGASSGGVPAVFVAPDGSFGSCRAI